MLGLARIRLYEDRLGEADALATRLTGTGSAVSPAAGILAETLRRRRSLETAHGTLEIPAGGTHVPFVITDPLPVVKVRLNDKVDAYFVIDTGAPNAVLDPDFAHELGIEAHGAGSGVFAGGAHAAISHATVDQLEVGDARVRNLDVTLLPTRSFGLDPAHRIDGALGTGFFYRFLTTLDYAHGELRLRPRSDSKTFEREAAGKSATVVPMWLVGDHFIFARGSLNDGPEQLFNVDTGGSGVGVTASKATVDNSHVVLDEAHASQGIGGGGTVKFVPFTAKVRLGDLSRDGIAGIFTPAGDPYGIFPFAVAGSFSHLFFRPYALTFDFVAMKLVVEGAGST